MVAPGASREGNKAIRSSWRSQFIRGNLREKGTVLAVRRALRSGAYTFALLRARAVSNPDLLPFGLYRRPRNFTGSWKNSGEWQVVSDKL